MIGLSQLLKLTAGSQLDTGGNGSKRGTEVHTEKQKPELVMLTGTAKAVGRGGKLNVPAEAIIQLQNKTKNNEKHFMNLKKKEVNQQENILD